MMKCPNCGEQIDELTEVCPKCKTNLEEFDRKHGKEDDNFIEIGNATKTTLLTGINVIQVVASIIAAIYFVGNGQGMTSLIIVVASVIGFAFIKGFADIIDLLTQINEKLK